MDINERIKLLRISLNLNQSEFAEKIGIKQAGISAIEKGIRSVTDRNVALICEKFNVNEEWLRIGKEPRFLINDNATVSLDEYLSLKKATSLDIAIIKSYLEIDEKQRQNILQQFFTAFEKINSSNISKFENIPKNNIHDYELAEELSPSNEEIEKELAAYRLELEAEQKGKTFLASVSTNTNNVNKAN